MNVVDVFLFVANFCILATSNSKMGIFYCKIPVFLKKTFAKFLRNKASLGKISSHFQLSSFVLREKLFLLFVQ
jgi:hypothetical protein